MEIDNKYFEQIKLLYNKIKIYTAITLQNDFRYIENLKNVSGDFGDIVHQVMRQYNIKNVLFYFETNSIRSDSFENYVETVINIDNETVDIMQSNYAYQHLIKGYIKEDPIDFNQLLSKKLLLDSLIRERFNSEMTKHDFYHLMKSENKIYFYKETI